MVVTEMGQGTDVGVLINNSTCTEEKPNDSSGTEESPREVDISLPALIYVDYVC